jgi:hypothetical protein
MQKIEIDFNVLDALLQFKASMRYCADYLGISHDTLERRVKEKKGCTFGEYADRQLDATRLKLQQKIITKALAGDNACLIFSLKNLCKWSDKVETNVAEDSAPLKLKYSLDDEER